MAHFRLLDDGRKAQLMVRFRGRQFSRTIKIANERDAERAIAGVEDLIQDLVRGKREIPEGQDWGEFLFSGGRALPLALPSPAASVTLGKALEAYKAHLTRGAKEESTRETEAVHGRHFRRLIGPETRLESIDLAAIQRYSDRRATEGIARATIDKELTSLLWIWRWAHRRGHVGSGPTWSRSEVTRPKGISKPPFMTWGQIEREIELERPDRTRVQELWERLWLDQAQTLECLEFVREKARHPFLAPMFSFAAYTGARRSEILRSRKADWDFPGGQVAIREKKADTRWQFTRRMIPIHPDLAPVMVAWFAVCPESPWSISTTDGEPIGGRMSAKYFRSICQASKWQVLHGWHVFRHSIASNMASSGVDQRLIDEILGHHTDEMARRYRHLLPSNGVEELNSLFRRGGP